MAIDRTQSCGHHSDERDASSTVLHNNDIDAETVDVKPDSEHVLGQLCETGCEMFNGECEMARFREIDIDKTKTPVNAQAVTVYLCRKAFIPIRNYLYSTRQ